MLQGAKAWETRGWAVLALAESAAKTVAAAVAMVVTHGADKVFGADWSHNVYGQAVNAHFESFWRSGYMIYSPNDAIISSFCNVEADNKNDFILIQETTLEDRKEETNDRKIRPIIGRIKGVLNWGDVGDLDQVAWHKKLGIVGPIDKQPASR